MKEVTKAEFIQELEARLSGLPKKEVSDRVAFYSEMIDDRIEEGLSEEAAVADVGTVKGIVKQIINEIPLGKIAKESLKKRRKPTALELTLIIIGSPIWLSILISLAAVVLSLYVSIWAVVISLWATCLALAVGGAGGVIGATVLTFTSSITPGAFLFSLSIFSMGAAIFAFFGCKEATRGTILLTKVIIRGIKNLFIGRGAR